MIYRTAPFSMTLNESYPTPGFKATPYTPYSTVSFRMTLSNLQWLSEASSGLSAIAELRFERQCIYPTLQAAMHVSAINGRFRPMYIVHVRRFTTSYTVRFCSIELHD